MVVTWVVIGGGTVLLVDLLVEIREGVFDAEDVHQLLREGAGDCASEMVLAEALTRMRNA